MSDPNRIEISESNVIVTRQLDISTFNTDELTEGSTNLYYTAERVDDRVAALLIDSSTSGIDISYDDANGQLTLSVDLTEVEDSLEDIVDGLITAGTGITATYDDSAGTLTLSSVICTIFGSLISLLLPVL